MSFAVVFVLHVHRACLTASDIFLLKNFGPARNGAAGHFWHHVLQPESFVLGCNLLLSNVLPSVKCRHMSIPCTNESAQPATSTIPYHCFFSAIGFHPRPRHIQQNYNIQSFFLTRDLTEKFTAMHRKFSKFRLVRFALTSSEAPPWPAFNVNNRPPIRKNKCALVGSKISSSNRC